MAHCCKCKITLDKKLSGYCSIHYAAYHREWYRNHKKEKHEYYKLHYKRKIKDKEIIICKVCKKNFEKKQYRQTMCGDVKCLEKNKRNYNKKYRKSHPDYFKKYLIGYRKYANQAFEF